MVIQPPNFRFDNDVAVVTGGGSGIGAHGFASRGARVLVLDVDATRACKVAKEIGDCTFPLLVDVTNQGSVGGAIGLIAKTRFSLSLRFPSTPASRTRPCR
jgi:NADP-dependent 3-hydroxy acid dehydrogenase YdfG